MRRTGSLFLLGLLFVFAATARAHELPSGQLAALGRVWGIVRYAHPHLGYRDVDLDAAVLAAIGHVRSAPSHASLTAAVDEMLSTLRDDATFVSRPCVESVEPFVDRRTRVLEDGVVYLSATTAADPSLLRDATSAVVDLRPQPGRCAAPALGSEIVPLLVRGSVPRVSHRKIRHHGYKASEADSAFTSSFVLVDGGTETGTAQRLNKVVFIVDEWSVIPPVATALAAAHHASFVSVGRFPLHTAIDHCQIALPDHSIVTLRTSELVDAGGFSAEPSPMITMHSSAPEGEVIKAALQLARPRSSGRRRSAGLKSVKVPELRWLADEPYGQMDLPDVEHRILAAFRLWNVVHFFHGSADRIPGWDMRMSDLIAMLEHASTGGEYELALAEIMASLHDGYAAVDGSATRALRGTAAPPFRLMFLDEAPVVATVQAGTTGVTPGDELLRIDGRDVAVRIAELERYTSAATAGAKSAVIAHDLPNGADGSKATFTFRRRDGTQYDVSLTRTTSVAVDASKAWKLLAGNVAYVDAARLDAAQVTLLFEEIAQTRAVIVDLRSSASPAHDELVRRLNNGEATATAAVRVPVLVGGAFHHSDSLRTAGNEPVTRYGGRTIALIDARTIGAAEETGIALSAVANARFVGSSSGGTSGPSSSFVVPGGIRVPFSAVDMRHVSGTPVQGVGIVPDVLARPTLPGLAEGRDEVLQRALTFVDE